MDYCNEVEGFINYTLFNSRNTSGGSIRNMIMDTMKMNHGYVCECSIIDEEPNVHN
jgi:hypothetical protein